MSTKLMSQRDRAELRRILKARFQLLHQQLHQREREVSNHLENQIRKEHEKAVKQAEKKTLALRKKAEKLAQEARELQAEMKDLGIRPETKRYNTELFEWNIADGWAPVDLSKKVQAAYKKVAEQAGLHKVDLHLQQLQLEEELAISALGSDEAKNFLSKVPDIDKLLPMNGNITAVLEEGEVIDAES